MTEKKNEIKININTVEIIEEALRKYFGDMTGPMGPIDGVVFTALGFKSPDDPPTLDPDILSYLKHYIPR